MNKDEKNRIDTILNLITELASGNLEAKATQSFENDELDAIVAGLNMLGEELGRRVSESKLNEEKFRSLAENSQDYIMRYDREGRHLYQNSAAYRVSGYCEEEFVGKTHRELGFEKSLCDLWESRIQQVFATKKPAEEVFEWESVDGRVILDWRLYPEFNAQGEVETVLAVSRDITEQKHQEARLRQAQKMESLGTLSAGIAHDFNNILHAILGYCRMAEQYGHDDGELLSQCLNEISSGAERAAALVNRIKAFSRIDNGTLASTPLNPIIAESLSLLEGNLPSNVEIQTDLDEKDVVFGDATQMHQVILNLCTNALHATEKQGGVISITTKAVSVERELLASSGKIAAGNYIVLTVSDTGSGIEPEIMARIFDPFYTTKDTGEGSGLGLTIVHGIVTSMNGAIQVTSCIDEGTSFSIYLPQSEKSVLVKEDEAVGSSLANMKGSVLFVDDKTAIAKLAKKYLEKKGFAVSAFNDPFVALEEFRKKPKGFSIVITDLSMPRMNGIEFAAKCKEENSQVPILLVSGHIDVNIEDRDLFSKVLSKPLNMSELVETIQEYV